MSTIVTQVVEDIKTAMKAKDQLALMALRGLKTALTNAAIEKGSLSTVLEESEAVAVLKKQIKQREDAADQYKKADRPELADKELAEIQVLNKYLPAQMGEAELAALVDAVIAELGATSKKDMGGVMKVLQERTSGNANGKDMARLVSQKLA